MVKRDRKPNADFDQRGTPIASKSELLLLADRINQSGFACPPNERERALIITALLKWAAQGMPTSHSGIDQRSYEVGYAEGENSACADWLAALGEEFRMPDLKGPQDFIDRMHGDEGRDWASQ